MTITITRNGDDFEVNATNLPAPLILSLAIAIDFAKALVSPDLSVAAWKTDKLVWAPATREPIGVWVSQSGQPSIWVAGVAEDITVAEAAALAKVVLLASAPMTIGTEVQPTTSLSCYTDGDPSAAYTGSASTNEVGTITEIYYSADAGAVVCKIDFGGGRIAPNIDFNYVRAADPLVEYEVDDTGLQYFSRSVRVQARTPTQARQLARPLLNTLAKTAWCPTGGVDSTDDYETTPVTPETDTDRNAAEGFIASADNGIQAYRDSQNVSIFEGDDDAAYRFVLDRALSGSARHIAAIRVAEACPAG